MKWPSLFLFCTLFAWQSFAQASRKDTLLTHYPMQLGNMWDYSGGSYVLFNFYYPSWHLVTATRDSLHPNGKKYIVFETTIYDMSEQEGPGSLGHIYKRLFLQRIDTTSLNVYRMTPGIEPVFSDEVLWDSLKADEGDTIYFEGRNYQLLKLLEIYRIKLFGKVRATRRLIFINNSVAYYFSTSEGLWEIAQGDGGDGFRSDRLLQGAVIRNDTLGCLLRTRSPGLSVSSESLYFTKAMTRQRLFLINRSTGLTIVDSVGMNNESRFYSQPFYHDAGFPHTIFSKGPFLVFPQDSIYLDIFLRKQFQGQMFRDTLYIYARGIQGDTLPRIDLPVTVDLTTSIHGALTGGSAEKKQFNLEVFPNPLYSQDDLSIMYQLSQPGKIKLEIYDVLGRRIATLMQGQVGLTKQRVIWDAHRIPSGMYFITISDEKHRKTIRLQVVK